MFHASRVNADTGAVTLDAEPFGGAQRSDRSGGERASAARLSAADLVTLTATITDGDGDTASATRNIGDAFMFEDDGPTITATRRRCRR